MTIYDDLSM